MSLANVNRIRAARARPAEMRATLTAALGTVPGLTASPSIPDQATAGAAWVKWIQTTYTGNLETPGIYSYDAFLVLPAEYMAETVDQGDDFLAAVVPALWPLAVVEYAEPVAIQFNDRQTMPGLRLRIVSR